MRKIPFIIFIITLAVCSSAPAQEKIKPLTRIEEKNTITIDGRLSEPEWKQAGTVQIKVREGWTVTVAYMQDGENLYFAFSNVKLEEKTELYPEVLLDTGNEKTSAWDNNDWWFHTSYSNCEGKGKFNDYTSCKKGEKEGWTGNNFPLEKDRAVEIKVKKSLIQVSEGDMVGMAFNVTDTQKNWYFFPAAATMEQPGSWMTVKL